MKALAIKPLLNVSVGGVWIPDLIGVLFSVPFQIEELLELVITANTERQRSR